MRPSKDEYFVRMAELVAERSTCLRRSVGCVLVSTQGTVLATGYNGVGRGVPHCTDHLGQSSLGVPDFPNACRQAFTAKSGEGLDDCRATHAEQNAVLQCSDVERIATAYVTVSPCPTCVRLLLNTGCARIVCLDEYANGVGWKEWVEAGRVIERWGGEPHMLQRDMLRLYGHDKPDNDDERRYNEWLVCVACCLMNLTTARAARPVIMRLMRVAPTPTLLLRVETTILHDILRPLGLSDRRLKSLTRMSWDASAKEPSEEWGGCGAYARESVRAFCRGDLSGQFTDRKVSAWVEWAREDRKTGPEKGPEGPDGD